MTVRIICTNIYFRGMILIRPCLSRTRNHTPAWGSRLFSQCFAHWAKRRNYQSSIPSEWNVDAECPRRYSKVFVYYNCVFTSTEKSNFVAVWNLVGGVTCITGKTVTILSFSIRAMCLNLYLKICTEHKGGFRVKQSA